MAQQKLRDVNSAATMIRKFQNVGCRHAKERWHTQYMIVERIVVSAKIMSSPLLFATGAANGFVTFVFKPIEVTALNETMDAKFFIQYCRASLVSKPHIFRSISCFAARCPPSFVSRMDGACLPRFLHRASSRRNHFGTTHFRSLRNSRHRWFRRFWMAVATAYRWFRPFLIGTCQNFAPA